MSENPNARGLNFTWADTISGYVTDYDSTTRSFGLETSDKRSFKVIIDDSTAGELLRNLGEPYADASGHFADTLVPGRFVSAYGIYYPGDELRFVAKHIELMGRGANDYNFEEPNWWTRQIDQLASFYRRAQFGTGKIDYRELPHLAAPRRHQDRQPCPGDRHHLPPGLRHGVGLPADRREDFLEVAEKGTEYLREHMRFVDPDEDVVYWYHGIHVDGDRSSRSCSPRSSATTSTPSRCTSRSTRSPARSRPTASPATRRSSPTPTSTMRLFDQFFLDHDQGGYFSHVDPILTLDRTTSRSASTQPRRKNWNSRRRPRPRLPDQPLPGHRRAAVRRTSSNTPSTRSSSTSPTTTTARSSRSGSTRTGRTTSN